MHLVLLDAGVLDEAPARKLVEVVARIDGCIHRALHFWVHQGLFEIKPRAHLE